MCVENGEDYCFSKALSSLLGECHDGFLQFLVDCLHMLCWVESGEDAMLWKEVK